MVRRDARRGAARRRGRRRRTCDWRRSRRASPECRTGRSGWRSRNARRPADESTSALVRTTAPIGEWRPCALRMQRGRRQDLLAQIDRGVEQDPVRSVNREGDAHLRARLDTRVATPGELADTRQPQFHCGTPPPAPEPRTSALSRALVGDIVEARRDMGRAARRRGKPSPLHQGTRRRVEIAVARGTGD